MSKEKNEVKPVELFIESDEVVKRYPITDAIEVVRCKTSIFLHSTGFFAVSKPTLANNLKGGALFETLRWYCDYQDKREEYTKEEQEQYDTICSMIATIIMLPIEAFTDADFMIDLADIILTKKREYYDRLAAEAAQPREETLEDALENAAFESEVRASEEIVKEMKELAEKKNGTDGAAS